MLKRDPSVCVGRAVCGCVCGPGRAGPCVGVCVHSVLLTGGWNGVSLRGCLLGPSEWQDLL